MSTFLDACQWLEQNPGILRAEAVKIVTESFARAEQGISGRPRHVGRLKIKSWLNGIRKFKPYANSFEQEKGEQGLASAEKMFWETIEKEIMARKWGNSGKIQ